MRSDAIHPDVHHAEQALIDAQKVHLYNITDPLNQPEARYWSYRDRDKLQEKCVWTSMADEGKGQSSQPTLHGTGEGQTESVVRRKGERHIEA